MLQNTLAASFAPLLDLPTEIHHKIKEFLGPKHALIPAHTCRTLFTIYGHDYIWEKWLQTEYQQPPLNQLSNDKFTFITRKIYQLKVENDKGCFLPKATYESLTRLLVIQNILTTQDLFSQKVRLLGNAERRLPEKAIKAMADSLESQKIIKEEDTYLLIESEIVDFYLKFNESHIKEMHTDNILSLNQIQKLTKTQIHRLKRNEIRQLFLDKCLSLEEINALTPTQFDRLCNLFINMLFSNKRLSSEDISMLSDNQIKKFGEHYVYLAFGAKLLSLEDVKSLTAIQMRRFNIHPIRVLFMDKLLSLQDLENLTDAQVKKLCDPDIEQRFRSGQLTFVGLET